MTKIVDSSELWQKVLVVFSGDVSRWWLRFLKKGFRHCFVTLGNGDVWLTIDPMLHKTDVVIQPVSGSFNMECWYKQKGYLVVTTNIKKAALLPSPLGIFTCVEVVKRILGIHDFWILTPYSLYKFLKNNINRKIVLDIK